MTVATFPASKVLALAKLSLDHPKDRTPSFEQRYDPKYLRDDLDPSRRAKIAETTEDGFSMDITLDDLDRSKIPAGVWMVGDQGVYLMSNVHNSALDKVQVGFERVVHCFETDPRNCTPEMQDDEKRRIFGGDDGVIFLEAETILALTENVEVIAMRLTPESIGFLPQDLVVEYMTAVSAEMGIPDYFDPDKKARSEFWQEPRTLQ